MATSGKTIINKVAGFELQWLQTAKDTQGAFVKCNMLIAPSAFMPVRHLHPSQTETFEVLTGQLRIECNGVIKNLEPGDSFTIPQNQPHQWWNASDAKELKMVVTMAPARNWETQMEQTFGIMNAKRKLSFLQVMVMQREYEMYIAGPPVPVQKILAIVLSPLAKIMGYKKFYPEYSL